MKEKKRTTPLKLIPFDVAQAFISFLMLLSVISHEKEMFMKRNKNGFPFISLKTKKEQKKKGERKEKNTPHFFSMLILGTYHMFINTHLCKKREREFELYLRQVNPFCFNFGHHQ